MAWLNASIPDTSKKGEFIQRRKAFEKRQSNLLRMPEIKAGHYLLSIFIEIGCFVNSANGIAPLPWQEIESYSKITGIELDSWEVLVIRSLSESYCSSASRADENSPAPYMTLSSEVEQKGGLTSFFKNLARARKNVRR